MNAARLSHTGIVQAIEGREALVVVDTGGCSACGHGSSCGVGQVAKGLPATVLAGDSLHVVVTVHEELGVEPGGAETVNE